MGMKNTKKLKGLMLKNSFLICGFLMSEADYPNAVLKQYSDVPHIRNANLKQSGPDFGSNMLVDKEQF